MSIDCAGGSIRIVDAMYGWSDGSDEASACAAGGQGVLAAVQNVFGASDCSVDDARAIVEQECHEGAATCNILVEDSLFGDECAGTSYLDVTYTCSEMDISASQIAPAEFDTMLFLSVIFSFLSAGKSFTEVDGLMSDSAWEEDSDESGQKITSVWTVAGMFTMLSRTCAVISLVLGTALFSCEFHVICHDVSVMPR